MSRFARLVLYFAVAVTALGSSLVGAVEGVNQHVVQDGDTLSALALRYGVPLEQLVSVNGIANPDLIVVGQSLRLLAESPTPTAPPVTEYVVKAGDTIVGVAQAHGVSAAAIVDANGLADPNVLVVGQKLTIPGQSAATAAPRATQTPAPRTAGPSAAPATAAADPEVAAALERQAAKYGLDPALLKALAWRASGWKTDRLGPNGTLGVLQISPSTFDWVEQVLLKRPLDRASLEGNAEAGAAYLAYLLKRAGDERTAIASYLQGPGSVRTNGISARTERALNDLAALRQRFGEASASKAAEQAAKALDAAVREAIASVGAEQARVGVSALNLTTGARYELRAGEQFPTASLAKVGIMVELYRQMETGKLRWTDQIRSDLEQMIILSDNVAADRLMDLVTVKAVNEGHARLGLTQTALRSHYSAQQPGDSGLNVSSPSDMARLFGEIAAGRVVSEAASKQMRELMARTRDGSKLRRGLPPGVTLAHKSGWYAGVSNDAGIVTTPRATYVVAVFTEGTPDGETGNQLVAAISRALYQAWGE